MTLATTQDAQRRLNRAFEWLVPDGWSQLSDTEKIEALHLGAAQLGAAIQGLISSVREDEEQAQRVHGAPAPTGARRGRRP